MLNTCLLGCRRQQPSPWFVWACFSCAWMGTHQARSWLFWCLENKLLLRLNYSETNTSICSTKSKPLWISWDFIFFSHWTSRYFHKQSSVALNSQWSFSAYQQVTVVRHLCTCILQESFKWGYFGQVRIYTLHCEQALCLFMACPPFAVIGNIWKFNPKFLFIEQLLLDWGILH